MATATAVTAGPGKVKLVATGTTRIESPAADAPTASVVPYRPTDDTVTALAAVVVRPSWLIVTVAL
jgi:hypothetical protein